MTGGPPVSGRRLRIGAALLAFAGTLVVAAPVTGVAGAEAGRSAEPVYDEIAGSFVAEGWSSIPVCAISAENQNATWCAITNAAHEYSIANLPPGEYVVYFPSPEPSQMASQYYRQAARRSEAQTVVVKLGFATRGVDEVMGRAPAPSLQQPRPAAPMPVDPVKTGTVSPAAPAPSPGGRIEPELILPLASSLSGKALGSLSALCRFAACHGSIKLVTHANGGRRREVVLGWVSFSLGREAPATLAMHLTPVGRRDLALAGRRPVSAAIVVRMGGANVLTRSVRLT